MKNRKLIPAPLDEKNITTDWIETIFDGGDRIVGGKNCDVYTGFVNDRPTNCFVNGNHLLWHIDKWMCGIYVLKDTYEELLRRLKEIDKENPNIVVEYDTSMKDELIIMQRFFFKDE